MPIEWMPRSPTEEDGWRDIRAGRSAPGALLDGAGPDRGVRVPVVVRRYRRRRLPRMTPSLTFQVVRFGLFGLVLSTWLLTFAWWFLRLTWWTPVLVASFVLALIYRGMRLHRFGRPRRADLLLTPAGIRVGGLAVPWEQVEEVVRFNFLFGPGPGGFGPRNYLAVRVRDFVGVAGLTPFRAGLANLTRRRLVVLAETAETREPWALAHALGLLTADAAARGLLDSDAGLHLVQTGATTP